MIRYSCLFFFLVLVCHFSNRVAHGQIYGIDGPRVPNTELLIDELPKNSAGAFETELFFPNFGYSFITSLKEYPDGSGRFIMTRQIGQIYHVPSKDALQSEITLLANLSSSVCWVSEQGLLDFEFDLDFETSGEVYVFYSVKNSDCSTIPQPSRLSRFTMTDSSWTELDLASEEILLEIPQPGRFHQSGELEFGPDGYLYVSIGDGGGTDRRAQSQDTSNLYGTIIRIDPNAAPDPGLSYAIPTDNPFYEGGPAGTATRKEIFAYGFRNPFRFSFDDLTGTLFSCDVGEDTYEEINVVTAGGNYGWGYREGFDCAGTSTDCDDLTMIDPVAGFAHEPGNNAITGGYVYYGSEHPDLYGAYLYADAYRGRIYAMRFDGSEVTSNELIATLSSNIISTFGKGLDGEIYIVDLKFVGVETTPMVYKLNASSGNTPSNFPRKLSDLPALHTAGSGLGHTVDGVYPYRPSSQLWSDNAAKERYVALPGMEQIELTDSKGWNFPDDTILIKNFSLPLDMSVADPPLKRIETRIMVKKEGEWSGFTYEWNEDETDATLLTASKTRSFELIGTDGEEFDYDWYYPSQADCRSCHTEAANHALGLQTSHMNFEITYPSTERTANQIDTMDSLELFTEQADSRDLPFMPDYSDQNETIARRTRAYFDSNCSMCHMPSGPTNVDMDLRFDILTSQMNVDDVIPANDLGVQGARRAAFGHPELSLLYLRTNTTDVTHRMPPLATSLVDEQGVELIRQWLIQRENTDASIWNQYK